MMILRFVWWYLVLAALALAGAGALYWASLNRTEPMWLWIGLGVLLLARMQWRRIRLNMDVYRVELVREMARQDMRARYL